MASAFSSFLVLPPCLRRRSAISLCFVCDMISFIRNKTQLFWRGPTRFLLFFFDPLQRRNFFDDCKAPQNKKCGRQKVLNDCLLPVILKPLSLKLISFFRIGRDNQVISSLALHRSRGTAASSASACDAHCQAKTLLSHLVCSFGRNLNYG